MVGRIYVGIDNGVTGSIGIIDGSYVKYVSMPTFKQQDYQSSKKSTITRIAVSDLMVHLSNLGSDVRVFIERPYVNPKGIKATVSGVRAFEATLVVIEMLCLSYEVIPSSSWQKAMLPPKCKGEELKRQSRDKGLKLFPELETAIIKKKDADGLLIAEWARRNNL